MKTARTIIALSLAVSVAGCATTRNPGPLPPGGKMPATKISALGGGLIGGAIGQNLANADKQKALEAEYRALE